MSRTVLPYAINGIVLVDGAKFWRIQRLDPPWTPLKNPAALVLIREHDPEASYAQARAVCEALNSHHAQAVMKLAMEQG